MSRNLLSEQSSISVYSPSGKFATGESITIKVYKNGSLEPLTTDVCTEILTTGVYSWSFDNLDVAMDDLSECYWIMSRTLPTVATYSPEKPDVFGGWVELLTSLPQALTPANMCRITTNLSRIDGTCTSQPGTVQQDNNGNTINLSTFYSDGSRYFELGNYKPSYDELTGVTYWLVPRLSTVDVNLLVYGVTKTKVLVPDASTIDLKVWLDSL